MSYFMTAGGSGIDMRGLEPFELMPGALTCVCGGTLCMTRPLQLLVRRHREPL